MHTFFELENKRQRHEEIRSTWQ